VSGTFFFCGSAGITLIDSIHQHAEHLSPP
jgi:hypothetical protein